MITRKKWRKEEERGAYERYSLQQADDLFPTLPLHEREALKAEATKLAGNSPYASRFVELRLRALVAARYADRLTTFENWRRSQGREL
jgi:hypothetical protein